jgi:hypothetical protein
MKTMMYYVRLAGVDIRGMSDVLKLHDPEQPRGQVVSPRRTVDGKQE